MRALISLAVLFLAAFVAEAQTCAVRTRPALPHRVGLPHQHHHAHPVGFVGGGLNYNRGLGAYGSSTAVLGGLSYGASLPCPAQTLQLQQYQQYQQYQQQFSYGAQAPCPQQFSYGMQYGASTQCPQQLSYGAPTQCGQQFSYRAQAPCGNLGVTGYRAPLPCQKVPLGFGYGGGYGGFIGGSRFDPRFVGGLPIRDRFHGPIPFRPGLPFRGGLGHVGLAARVLGF